MEQVTTHTCLILKEKHDDNNNDNYIFLSEDYEYTKF